MSKIGESYSVGYEEDWLRVTNDPLELTGDLLEESQNFLELLFKKIGISEKPVTAIVYFRERLSLTLNKSIKKKNKTEIISTKVIYFKDDGKVYQQIDQRPIPPIDFIDSKDREKLIGELGKNYIDKLTFLSKANNYLFLIDFQYGDVIGSRKKAPWGLTDGLVTIFGVAKDIKNEIKNYTFLIEVLRLFTKDIHIHKLTSELIDDLLVKAGKITLNDKIYKSFMNDIGKNEGFNLFELMHNISLLKYESSENHGNILFCSCDIELEDKLILSKPISLIEYSSVTAIRKLLEISSGNVSLLCDGEFIYGIGKRTMEKNLPKKTFRIEFKGQGEWDVVTSKDKKVMSVANKVPSMPKTPVKEPEFAKKFELTFNSSEYENTWKFINSAKNQPHGTMVVITKSAKGEAERLCNQSFLINKKSEIQDSIIKGITAIDGAILLDETGVCYAIGVILDGIANEYIGTISRGARYNSALRYLNYCKGKDIPCLIVIVSEDKNIDIKTVHDL
ncbi:hypothetical protein COI88_27905 [Bacillus cereus]|nr:hypothetical protein COI88_27905 [Bacillus cereus]